MREERGIHIHEPFEKSVDELVRGGKVGGLKGERENEWVVDEGERWRERGAFTDNIDFIQDLRRDKEPLATSANPDNFRRAT